MAKLREMIMVVVYYIDFIALMDREPDKNIDSCFSSFNYMVREVLEEILL